MCSFWPCTRTKVQDTIEISDTTLVALDLAIKICLPLCSLMQQLDWPDRSPGQGPLLPGPGVPRFVFFPQSWLLVDGATAHHLGVLSSAGNRVI